MKPDHGAGPSPAGPALEPIERGQLPSYARFESPVTKVDDQIGIALQFALRRV